MPTYRKRPRKKLPPPLAGGGAADASPLRGRGPVARARDLRANATDAERKLWEALRRKQISGHRFRRQYPLGPYFADFVCLPVRLIVEVDGGQHAEDEQRVHDEKRTAWLARNRFRVLRFWNWEVRKNLEGVIGAIEHAVRDTPPPEERSRRSRSSAPSRKGRGNDNATGQLP